MLDLIIELGEAFNTPSENSRYGFLVFKDLLISFCHIYFNCYHVAIELSAWKFEQHKNFSIVVSLS
jgi:hypothetical protein